MSGFYNIVISENEKLQFAKDGEMLKIEYVGSWKGRQYKKGRGEKQMSRGQLIDLNEVMFAPDLRHNLYSLTKAISEGEKLSNDNDIIIKILDLWMHFMWFGSTINFFGCSCFF